MLTTPPKEESSAVFADWLEFCAVVNSAASFSELTRAWEEEDGENDNADVDALAEETKNLLSLEVEKRIRLLKGAYPFFVDNDKLR